MFSQGLNMSGIFQANHEFKDISDKQSNGYREMRKLQKIQYDERKKLERKWDQVMTSGHIKMAFSFLLESVQSVLRSWESLKDFNTAMTRPDKHWLKITLGTTRGTGVEHERTQWLEVSLGVTWISLWGMKGAWTKTFMLWQFRGKREG